MSNNVNVCASPLSRSKDFFLPLAITEQAPLLVGCIPGVAAHHKQRRLGGPPLERGLIRQERPPAPQHSCKQIAMILNEAAQAPSTAGRRCRCAASWASTQLSVRCPSAPHQDRTALRIGRNHLVSSIPPGVQSHAAAKSDVLGHQGCN